MEGRMRTLLSFVAMLLVIFGAVYVLGNILPVEHTTEVTKVIDAPQAEVWQRITDLSTQTQWRHEVKSIDVLPPRMGSVCWTEHQRVDVNFCVESQSPPARRVIDVEDVGGGFSGTWTYTIFAVSPNQTSVIVTEEGSIHPPLWRVASRLMGEDAQVKRYLQALETSFTGKEPHHSII